MWPQVLSSSLQNSGELTKRWSYPCRWQKGHFSNELASEGNIYFAAAWSMLMM